MAVSDIKYTLPATIEHYFWSKIVDSNSVYSHLIISGLDSDIKVEFYQGNTNEFVNSTPITYTDADGVDKPIEVTLTNGKHYIALDTFYLMYGWLKVNPLSATTGELRIITVTKDI